MGESCIGVKMAIEDDIDPAAHGFRVDVSDKTASSEAELANRSIDKNIPEFEKDIDHEVPHDKDSVEGDIYKESLSKDRSDRLGLVRAPDPNQKTSWMRDPVPADDREEVKLAEEKAQEPDFPFGDGEPIYAFFANDARSVLTFFLRMPDDRVESHSIDSAPMHKAAWHHLRKHFSEDILNKNTAREINKITRMRSKDEDMSKERDQKEKQEGLFGAKVEAFELEVVSRSQNRELKSAIRRSKSTMEVIATVGALIALEQMTKNDTAE
jgi:hypothetical protein